MKDKREILTRETVAQRLIWRAKRSMVGAAIVLFLSAVILGMFHVMTLYESPSPSALLTTLELALDVLMVSFCVFYLVRGALQIHWVRKGKFTVAEDILLDVKEDKISLLRVLFLTGRLFDRSNYVHVFSFLSGKQFIATSGEHHGTDAAAGFSLPGDAFFLVFFDRKPEKILLLYSARTYHYKE